MIRDIISTLLVSLNDVTSNRSASGTNASVSSMSAFCTHRSATLFSIFDVRIPGFSFRTMNPLISPSTLLRAQTMTTSANVAFPIHRFLPLSRQPFGTLVADVVSELASDPLLGSVRAHAPTLSKFAMRGSHSRFWASVPSMPIVSAARNECTR